uniref:PedO n=1 Tax=symbiont bacterium of Paederus fuscipes TaxID=176282 RepID=Q5I688_UNCXX|nr:PedO [symbiont bacterium of Paederus fuscipes]
MSISAPDFVGLLKQRLLDNISTQIDHVFNVPADIQKMLGGSEKNLSLEESAKIFDAGIVELMRKPEEDSSKEGGSSFISHVNNHYDHVFYDDNGMTGVLFGDTDYRNHGYWDRNTVSQDQACRQLQEILLDFIPVKTGKILDVACGMGASTRHLLKYYPAENIWAINISDKQIDTARRNAPGCHVQVMDATNMSFADEAFENILCIEAAFHFNTRRKFLEEALRILKPGGRVVLSDFIFSSPERLEQNNILPGPVNHLASIEEYAQLLNDVGFSDFTIQDVSDEVWGGQFLNGTSKLHKAFYDGKLDIVRMTEALWCYYYINASTEKSLFVSAQK